MNVNIEDQFWLPIALGAVGIVLGAVTQTTLGLAGAAIGAVAVAIGLHNYWRFGR